MWRLVVCWQFICYVAVCILLLLLSVRLSKHINSYNAKSVMHDYSRYRESDCLKMTVNYVYKTINQQIICVEHLIHCYILRRALTCCVLYIASYYHWSCLHIIYLFFALTSVLSRASVLLLFSVGLYITYFSTELQILIYFKRCSMLLCLVHVSRVVPEQRKWER